MVTNPYIAPSGRLLILISHPIYNKDGTYRGIIGGTIYLQEKNVLNEMLGNDIIDEHGSYYYVVGPNGKLLFHPFSKRVGEDVTGNLVVRKVTEGESGRQRVTNTKDEPMLAAYNTVPETEWGVIQQTPVSYVHQLLKEHILKLITYMIIPFTLLFILSVFFARKLAKPFLNLADIVNQLASGKSVTTPEVYSHWNREADLLRAYSLRLTLYNKITISLRMQR